MEVGGKGANVGEYHGLQEGRTISAQGKEIK